VIETLKFIIKSSLDRLSSQLRDDLPPVIAAVIVLLAAYVLARLARWLTARVFKGIQVDRWLSRSGMSVILDHSGTLKASRAVAQTMYWVVLGIGFLVALNVFGTGLTTRIAENVVTLIPRLIVGALIVVGGLWLGQYLGRGALVWAVNEDLPYPRRFSMGVRCLIVFAAVVVAADTLNFARVVFLAAFILVLGGLVLAGALALGLGLRDNVRGRLGNPTRPGEPLEHAERSLWNHL
jgi:hypothetical protein